MAFSISNINISHNTSHHHIESDSTLPFFELRQYIYTIMPSIKLIAITALLAVASQAAPATDSLDIRADQPAGFKVPDGQKDGIYSVHIDENGKHVHQKIGDINKPAQDWADKWKSKAPRGLTARSENAGMNCVDKGAVLDDSEVSRAAYNLGTACDAGGPSWVPERSSQYAVSGATLVFTCNHMYKPWSGSNARGCSTTEVINDMAFIEAASACNHKEGILSTQAQSDQD